MSENTGTHNLPRRRFIQQMGMETMALTLPRALHAGNQNAQHRPPNILLIVSDDQGYNDLGCYGNSEIKTPNLDRLAGDGVRLTSFYVTWPACTPSRGSLLTGRFPQRNGTYDMFRNNRVDYDYQFEMDEYAVSPEKILGMDTREVLLPRVLSQAGYTSGIYGKWDLGMLQRFLPLQRGFDDFYGFVNTGIDYWTHERYGIPSMYRNNSATTEDKGTYCTDLFEREALRFLDEYSDRPFFCYVPFNAPHGASNLERPRPGVQAPLEYIQKHYGPYDPKEPNTREARRKRYMAAVTYMDESIGRLLDALEKNNVADNTIVIFFSDNGGSGIADNAPLRGHKAQMFEGGLRVPCIVRWPDVIPSGRVCDDFLTSLEIFPMLCNAVGVNPLRDVVLDGFDMRPVLAGKTESLRREMFWERRGDQAARVNHWKWVNSARGSGLFDLSKDIAEQNDLSEQKPEILELLKGRFNQWKTQMAEADPRRPFRDF